MAFLLLFLFISSLHFSSSFPVTTHVDSPQIPQPLPNSSPSPSDCPFSESPAAAPAAPPVDSSIASPNQPFGEQQQPTIAAPVSGPNQPFGQQQQQPTAAAPGSGPNQPFGQQQQPTAIAPVSGQNRRQQQLGDSVSGGNDQDQDQEPIGVPIAGLGPSSSAGVQPVGLVNGGVQPNGDDDQGQVQGLGQGQQALGFGAQPLVDNTPYDSGSSRMGWSVLGYALAFIWFHVV